MPQCKHFVKDTIGFGQGIGNCQLLIDYQAKGATEAEIEGVKRQYLGSRDCFWWRLCFDNERRCTRFEERTDCELLVTDKS